MFFRLNGPHALQVEEIGDLDSGADSLLWDAACQASAHHLTVSLLQSLEIWSCCQMSERQPA